MSLAAVVFVPHPPLLLATNAGAVDAGRELRERCRLVLAQACLDAAPDAIVLLTGSGDERRGVEPLGVRVGRELLAVGAGARSADPRRAAAPASPLVMTVPRDAGREQIARAAAQLLRCCETADRVLLLVAGDGSARRDERSPGLPDDRALAYDDALVRAVREADAAALADLSAGGRDDELLIGGRAALQTAGQAVTLAIAAGARVRAREAALVDDFGVAYVIGWWACASS